MREDGRAHRRVRALVGGARDAPDDLGRAHRVQQAAPEVGEEGQLAVRAFERALARGRLKVRAHARQQLARGGGF
jgi:hypothetical protein